VHGKLSPFIELGAGFNPELTARDNVRINATLLGLSKRELTERYPSIVAFSQLERFMDQKLKNFSSGMQIRLAYAIAIQVVFDILLLDEVLAVGDAEFQERCFATFDRFRDDGKTIVFVSHDLSSVKRFSDRVLYIDGGRAVALGAADDVIATYLDAHAPTLTPA
jgi:ABC-type polysaccharide/polyol phosphate transport system ATPase subunit